MENIWRYFPQLSPHQQQQIKKMQNLYAYWNAQINVISRKDMDHFYLHHVLHSLGIARVQEFKPGMRVLDVGTGGGFPGIPLAVLFPETEFLLIDSIAKKIKVVEAVADDLGLKNLRARQMRAEKVKGQFHFIVSRAVTQMPRFLTWTRHKLSSENYPGALKNGILYLKGGDLSAELQGIDHRVYPLNAYFTEAFFDTKKVVYVPAKFYENLNP